MKLKFHGGAQEVGRSCVVVNDTFLLDAGLKIKEHNGGVEYPSDLNLRNIQCIMHLLLNDWLSLVAKNGCCTLRRAKWLRMGMTSSK